MKFTKEHYSILEKALNKNKAMYQKARFSYIDTKRTINFYMFDCYFHAVRTEIDKDGYTLHEVYFSEYYDSHITTVLKKYFKQNNLWY